MTDKDIYGLDPSRSDNDEDYDLHEKHIWSSHCKECELSPEEKIIAKKIAKSLGPVKPFWKNSIWITGLEEKEDV